MLWSANVGWWVVCWLLLIPEPSRFRIYSSSLSWLDVGMAVSGVAGMPTGRIVSVQDGFALVSCQPPHPWMVALRRGRAKLRRR